MSLERMERSLEISLDKLPIKRLEAIEENGVERFPSNIGYDEKRVNLIRRIDFAWAVEREDEEEKKKKKKKKQKKKASEKEGSSSSSANTTPAWPWQSMVENLKLAHQELTFVIDLINYVEANDAVTVAGMTRPKPLPNEVLADLAVSTATKLRCYRNLGKYFKQSAKSLEQQITREARFYGALIRLQQNWKVKRQRTAATAPGNEGFTIDLSDNSLYDSATLFRPSSLSTIRVEHDPAGILMINLPPNSHRYLHFGFLGVHSNESSRKPNSVKTSAEHSSKETEKDSANGNESVKETHTLLRDIHHAIFNEQVFDMVNLEAFNQSVGANVTGIRENYLQLSIGPATSVFISLVPSNQDDQTADTEDPQNLESSVLPLDSFDEVKSTERKHSTLTKKSSFPNFVSYQIYLQQMFQEHVLQRAKDRSPSAGGRISGQPAKDRPGLLGHLCLSLNHRIFSNKVLSQLENVVCGVPYLHLITHPTWHSRTSSWTILMKVPGPNPHASSQPGMTDMQNMKNVIKSEFRTKVVVNDDCISIEAEGAPNLVSLFKGSSDTICTTNKYDCDLADLPVIILQQVASQVIRWLHEEALTVGIKAHRDFLRLSFELEQGEILSLVGRVDPDDTQGCISWWLVMEDGFAEEKKLHLDISDGTSECRKFLGYLTLDVLHSTLMDLVSLCGGCGRY